MLLKQLINGRQFPEFILVKDNALISGHGLLSLIIHERLLKGIHTYFLAYEPNDYSFLKDKHSNSKLFRFLDCSGDSSDYLKDIVWIKDKLRDEQAIAVIVDSISSSVLRWSFRGLFSTIRSLQGLNEGEFKLQLVGLLHSDVTPDDTSVCKQLHFMARCVIAIEKEMNKCVAKVETTSNSGKITKEKYTLGSSLDGTLSYELCKEDDPKPTVTEEEDSGPKVRTTFKLSLDENEKKSRSQVVLPYTRAQGEGSGGRIFYEPDANDDWDDEDPDDDLEI